MKAPTAFAALLCLCLGLPSAASASCFYIFSGDNLIYRSTRPPVDLSKQIHEGLTGRLAGAHLTMIPDETGCPELLANGVSDVFASSGGSRSAVDASPLFRGTSAGDGGTGTTTATGTGTAPSEGSPRTGRRAPAAARPK